MRESRTAVLLMAYGTPASIDDVEAYYTHIRGGRVPTSDAVQRLQQRYARVGGQTPLVGITEAVRSSLERELDLSGEGYPVYVGMKHWHPFIAETMRDMQADGVTDIIAVALAPHYSRMSIGGYRKAVEAAQLELGQPFTIEFVKSWHRRPEFVELMIDRIEESLSRFGRDGIDEVMTVFTAHSLPKRIREWSDPYERELLESAEAVASGGGIRNWCVAWQSAGETGEPWIGPDILDKLDELRAQGWTAVLQVPIGFVSDHLEILYDIDVEAAARADELGMQFRRTELPNAAPAFIRVLAALVRDPASALHTVAAPAYQ